MGFLDSIKAMFSEGTKSMEEDLGRREAELNATPEQRMDMLQGEIDDNDSAFEELQSKIDHKGAVALANTELDEQEVSARENQAEQMANPVDPKSNEAPDSGDTDDAITDAILVETDDEAADTDGTSSNS